MKTQGVQVGFSGQLGTGVDHLRRESSDSCRVPAGQTVERGAQRWDERSTGKVVRAPSLTPYQGTWPCPRGKHRIPTDAAAVTAPLNPWHLSVSCQHRAEG